jgi:cytochrome c oxidase assembly protein subunit 11
MPPVPTSSGRRNLRLALICVAVFVGMTGVAFASVPFYKAFCQLTGFDGTPQRADAAPKKALDRTVTVRFDANVRGGLPWTFTPSQVTQEVRIGAQTLAHYKVTNTGKTAVTGQAVFNVVPEQAGIHFTKIECFCFSEQTVQPGETVEYPVIYFIDPAFATDPDTRVTPEITLSYTFFPAEPSAPAKTVAAKPSQGLGEPPRAGL